MKNKYISPDMEILEFDNGNIITTSTTTIDQWLLNPDNNSLNGPDDGWSEFH